MIVFIVVMTAIIVVADTRKKVWSFNVNNCNTITVNQNDNCISSTCTLRRIRVLFTIEAILTKVIQLR